MAAEEKLAVLERDLAAYTHIIVAFSGGADSRLALELTLRAAARDSAKRVYAWYCHHYTTPLEAARAAVFAETLARARDLVGERFRSLTHQADISTIAKRLGYSWEHSASALRRKKLMRWRDHLANSGPAIVITGHTLSDYHETLELRRERAIAEDALPGLSALDEFTGFLRPLYNTTRAEVRRLARQFGLSWYDDPANDDLTVPRNRVRAKLGEATMPPAAAPTAKPLPEFSLVSSRELTLPIENWMELEAPSRARLQYRAFRRLGTVKRFTRNDFSRASRLPFALPPYFSHAEKSAVIFRRGLGASVALPAAAQGPYVRGDAARRGMTVLMPYGRKSVTKIFSEQKLSPRERRRKILYLEQDDPTRVQRIQ